MFIKSISLKNFKKFSELKIDFPADITVVRGPNERGKSTLLSAFLAGLFYDPKKINQDIQALKSWNSDRMYEIGLSIEHDGEDLELYKSFESGEAYLANKTKSEKLTTHAQIGEYLYKIGALRKKRRQKKRSKQYEVSSKQKVLSPAYCLLSTVYCLLPYEDSGGSWESRS